MFAANGKNPLISVVVPVYNAARTINKCVDSLISQTYENIEVLLINNGSTDDSLNACQEIASKDVRVRVFNQCEKGVSAARNRGIHESVGEYVLFVDADDWVDSDVCKVFAELNAKNDYDLFCFSAKYHKRKKITTTYLFERNIDLLNTNQKEELQIKVFAPLAPDCNFKVNTRFSASACGKFYKRKMLVDNNLLFAKETIISEDCLFNVLVLDYPEKIGFSREVYYHYEQHFDNSAQNSYRRNSEQYFAYVINQIKEWLLKTKKNQRFIDAANCLFVHYIFGTLKEDFFHLNNTLSFEQKRKKAIYVFSQSPFRECLNEYNPTYFSLIENILIALIKRRQYAIIRVLLYFYNMVLSFNM